MGGVSFAINGTFAAIGALGRKTVEGFSSRGGLQNRILICGAELSSVVTFVGTKMSSAGTCPASSTSGWSLAIKGT